MPRVSDIYTQPFPDVIDGTTIEPTVYNGFTHDVEEDLNTPRPIVAGGTGATSATEARDNIDAEVRGVEVTNYDSHVWEAGSFHSIPSATGGPVVTGAYMSGICHMMDDSHITLEARLYTGGDIGTTWTRQKVTGVWQPWERSGHDTVNPDGSGYSSDVADMFYGFRAASPNSYFTVNTEADLTGQDIFWAGKTGEVGIQNLIGSAKFYFSSSTGHTLIESDKVGTPQWSMVLGDGTAANDFHLYRHNDAGAAIADTLSINRLNGSAVIRGSLTTTGDIHTAGWVMSGQTATAGTYYFGSNGTSYLNYDGANYNLVGGSVTVAGNIAAQGEVLVGTAGGVGTIRFTVAGDKFLHYDGTNFTLNGGTYFTTSAQISSNSGYMCRAGIGGATAGNCFNIHHINAVGQELWIDTVRIGYISITSDYRIKKDVIDLPGMWDTVKALRPIKYTQAEFSPPSYVKHVAKEQLKARKEAEENPEAKPREVSTAPFYANEDTERWGFIAHELQETLTPSAANGAKDSEDTVQSLNLATVVAALTKALQEAMARIEALEAGSG